MNFAWAPVQKVLRRLADRSTGPSEEELRTGRSRFWGEVSNASGECRTARLETANGYRLTADGVLVEHDSKHEEKTLGYCRYGSAKSCAAVPTCLMGRKVFRKVAN